VLIDLRVRHHANAVRQRLLLNTIVHDVALSGL
jgi:phosphoribosylformylglycinamidine (FGAM) synthase PurS component